MLTNVMQALARHMSLWLVLDLNFSIAHSSSSAMDAVIGAAWNTKEVWLAEVAFVCELSAAARVHGLQAAA